MPKSPTSLRFAVVVCALTAPLSLARTSQDEAPAGSATRPPIRFVDVTDRLGVDFDHQRGDTPHRHMPETMGSGLAWLDYDLDGRLDLYWIDSGDLPGTQPDDPDALQAANELYRSRPDDAFDLGRQTGLEDDGYGMGAAVGDFDADGWPDVLVTNFGPDRLFRNNGDGSFTDVTSAAGIDNPGWGTSAAWADLDLDGLLDLYVVNYVRYSVADAPPCGQLDRGIRTYCPPQYFDGAADRLYRNASDGTFVDASARLTGLGPPGKGLGIAVGHLDEDGWPDLYVANDTTENFYLRNHGDFTFEEIGLLSGVAYGDDGRAQSGMGVDLADLDGDGHAEILVTNFSGEPYNVYRRTAPDYYVEDSYRVGLGLPSVPLLGFGIAAVDLDGDRDLDVAIANGHLHAHFDNYAQPNQVFENQRIDGDGDGGLLVEVTESAGEAVGRLRVSRALAPADVDADGWPDLAVSNSGGPAEILRNATTASAGRAVLRLRGREANRDGLNVRVRVDLPGEGAEAVSQHLETRRAFSYLAQGSGDLYLGLGDADAASILVRWPGGGEERLAPVHAGELVLAVQGRGIVAREPLSGGLE